MSADRVNWNAGSRPPRVTQLWVSSAEPLISKKKKKRKDNAGVRFSGLESRFYYLLVVCLLATYFISIILNFLICEMGVIIIPTLFCS